MPNVRFSDVRYFLLLRSCPDPTATLTELRLAGECDARSGRRRERLLSVIIISILPVEPHVTATRYRNFSIHRDKIETITTTEYQHLKFR